MAEKDVARIVRPENKLKKKIGHDVNMREILQPEIVEGAQQMINSKIEDFLSWARADMAEMERAYTLIQRQGMDREHLRVITANAEKLRDRSGTFGYQLGSQIAKSLVKFTQEMHGAEEHVGIILRKHMDGLETVFRGDIKGDGGKIGVELLDGLRKLIAKYEK